MNNESLDDSLDLLSTMENLNEDERREVERVLNEYKNTGNSSTLNQIYAADYDEVPVDIYTFITNKRYLGGSFVDDDGKLAIYDYWVKVLCDIFAPNNQIMEVAFSGAIGVGKSTIACVGLAYILYQLLCLKNPASYYNLRKGSNVAIALFNISMDQSYGVGWKILQDYLKNSPWFLDHGTLVGNRYKTYYPGKGVEILVGSKMEHFLGRDVFAAFMDEIEFAPGANPQMELSAVMKVYTTIRRRMESRFMMSGKVPGKMFLVSSKKSESDFLEQYIHKNAYKKSLYIVDEPIWVIKNQPGRYCGKTFYVAIGNKYLHSKILDDNEDPKPYRDNGQEVIEVPIEHREAFELDINSALMDIAGKALATNLKYIYYDKLKLSYRDYLKNPFTMDEISLGFDDDSELQDYLDHKLLSKYDKERPCFVHWDASKNGDATGLAMSTIAGHREVRKLVNGELYSEDDIIHKVIFAIRIKAKPGSEIPFYKIRNFIYYLKFELGYNIVSVTCDSFQSVDSIQQMKLKGFNADTLSVDRTYAPYETIKNAINEERIIMPYVKILETEFLELEDDKVRGKVDHPTNGSKDIADAVTGSVFRSLQYKSLLAEQNKSKDAQSLVVVNKKNSRSLDDWIIDPNKRVYD